MIDRTRIPCRCRGGWPAARTMSLVELSDTYKDFLDSPLHLGDQIRNTFENRTVAGLATWLFPMNLGRILRRCGCIRRRDWSECWIIGGRWSRSECFSWRWRDCWRFGKSRLECLSRC